MEEESINDLGVLSSAMQQEKDCLNVEGLFSKESLKKVQRTLGYNKLVFKSSDTTSIPQQRQRGQSRGGKRQPFRKHSRQPFREVDPPRRITSENFELFDLIKSLKTENEILKNDFDKQATLYDDKIKKYELAILERDQMINQLKYSLGNCTQRQNQLEKELHGQADEFNIEFEKLREDLFGKELNASNDIAENYRELQTKGKKLLRRIHQLNENLDASNQDKEFLVKKWETKCDNMISSLKALHNAELVEMKLSHENEISEISKQFEILERNHKEDHSHIMKSLKEVIDTKDCIQNELKFQKEQRLIASSKLKETQKLLESLQEFCKTSELSYKELLSQQHEKNVFDSETIMHLESELLKNNELITKNESTISVLTSQLKAEKKLKSELHSILQVANTNLDVYNKEILSLSLVKDTLQYDMEMYRTKNGDTKTEIKNLSPENECSHKEIIADPVIQKHGEGVDTLKVDFCNEAIAQFNSKLIESEKIIRESDTRISLFKNELISAKERNNELSSLLQISNANLDSCNKELSSLSIIRDSLQLEKETKLEETHAKINILNFENKSLRMKGNDKNPLDERVQELHPKVIGSENMFNIHKESEDDCRLLKENLRMLHKHIISQLCPEDKCFLQLNENLASEGRDEFQVLGSCFDYLLAKFSQAESFKNQDLTHKEEASFASCDDNIENGRNMSVLDEHCNARMGISSGIVDGEKEMEGTNIRTGECLCGCCKANLPSTEDKGFQTCITGSSSCHIATKTIEEDYLMEEILIFPQRLEKRGSCMKIKDSANLNEWKKKYFDVKFVNKSLMNENLSLKKALCDANADDDSSKISSENKDKFKTLKYVKNVCNLPAYEQEDLTIIMSPNVKLLEDNHQQEDYEMNTSDIFNTIFKNSEEFIVGNYSDVLCEENVASNHIRPSFLKGQSIEQEMIDLLIDRISGSSSRKISALIPEPDNVQVKILQIELQIQVLFCEILKQLFKDKEINKDTSKEQLSAQEYIRYGIDRFLENSCKSSLLKKNLADCLFSDWLQALQECLTMQTVATSDTTSQIIDTTSLLQSIEERLRNVLNQQQENRIVWKEVVNNLIASLENFHLMRDKETLDRSVIPLSSVVDASSKCGLKSSGDIPVQLNRVEDIHGCEVDNAESEAIKRKDLKSDQTEEFDLIDNSADEINRQILREFDDVTLSFVNHELNEKIKIVETQKNLLMKILLNNHHKIADICQQHLEKLKSFSTTDLDHLVDSLIDDIKQSLSEETNIIENEYGEFLKQYTHEQSLHFNTHSHTFMELKERISVALQDNAYRKNCKMTCENKNNGKLFSEDLSSLKFEEKVAALSSFTDLETQKGILNIMTLMTLNLMHYYSISQCTLGPDHTEEDNFETAGAIDISFNKSQCSFDPCSSVYNKFTKYVTLYDDQLKTMDHDEGNIQNPLDTTAVSEGMLEDLDTDEQIKKVLSSVCPNLKAALKGKLDEISMTELEKEVQEFIISLQASAGMLKIKLAKGAMPNDISVTLESGYIPELSQHPISYISDADSLFICREIPSLQDCFDSCNFDSMELKDWSNYEHKEIDDNLDAGQSLPLLGSELMKSNKNIVCLQGDTTLDYTYLRYPKVHKNKLIKSMSEKLRELLEEQNLLKKQLHQINGHLKGVLEEKKAMEQEKYLVDENNMKLSVELQELKDLLQNSEYKNKELLKTLAASPNKKRSPREIKEKVKAILAAKDIDNLEQKELVTRVRDLENIVEDLVRSKEEISESFNIKVADLTQQLDHADLQLKKSRLFLDQQAAERDQEFDVLIKENAKLSNLFKEKEALAIQHQNILKDVSGFEKELFDKNAKWEAAKQEIVGREADLKRALDKIKDLRDITQSLELQLNTKCSENLQLNEKVKLLTEDLIEENRLFQDAKMQLENLCDRRTSIVNTNVEFNDSSMLIGRHILGQRRDSKSLSEEFDYNREEHRQNASQEHAMLNSFVDLLQRSAGMLESLHANSTSGLALSDEELSVRERLESSRDDSLEESHPLSPLSLEHKLGERFVSFERTVETAVKYSRDLVMRIKVMKTDYEEVLTERDELHQKLSCFLDLKAKLENSVIEYHELQQSFVELKKELLDTQEKLSINIAKISELDLTNKVLKEDIEDRKKLIDSISSENSELLLNIEVLETKVKELEKMQLKNDTFKAEQESKILELCAERNCLQKQYSSQLLKLSSMESRLEDIRRANSPLDHEYKIKISSLQDDLMKNREEMTLMYRQNEELHYTLRDLKEKLLLRDEELDRINSGNFSQPSSLPQTAADERLHEIQRLKSELTKQNEEYEKLNEKLKKENEKLIVSGTLLKDLLGQRTTEINHFKSEFNSLKPISEMLIPLVHDGLSYGDIFQLLKNYLMESCLHSQDNRSPEIPRKHPEKSPSAVTSYLTPSLWDMECNKHDVFNESALEETDDVTSIQPSTSINLSLESIIFHGAKDLACAKDLRGSTAELDPVIFKSKLLENEVCQHQELNKCKKAETNSLHGTTEYQQYNETILTNKSSAVNQVEKDSTLEKADDTLPDSGRTDRRKYLGKIKLLEETLEKVKRNEINLQKGLNLLEEDIKEKQCLLSQQNCMLTMKDQEVDDLNVQLSNLITQLKDNSTINEKRLNQAYKMHSTIMHEMNQKDIEREKQLCNDYEERMASQVTDLSKKLAREKSESLKQMRDHYVTLLKEKDSFVEELLRKNNFIGKIDSAEDLRLKLWKEPSNIAQLGSDTIDHGQRKASHDFCAVSETGTHDKITSVSQRIHMLISKVFKEGEQVLTESERLFLEQNCNTVCATHLSERSSPDNSAASHITLDDLESFKQLSRSEKETNKRINLLKYCSKQGECFAEDWHEKLEMEKIENDKLRKQISSEKFHSFNLTSELAQVKCHLQIFEKQIQKMQQERDSVISQIESFEQQIQDLEEALHAERNNFSRVSLTLNHQRKLATSTSEHQNKLIQELRKTLDDERKRGLNLVSQLHKSKLSPEILALLSNNSSSMINEHFSVCIDKEMETVFAKDQEIEMKLKLEEAELNLKTLKEKYIKEQGVHLSQLGEEQMKVTQLKKIIVFYETEKETLRKNLHLKTEEILQLKEQLSKLLKDYMHVKSELSLLSSFCQKGSEKDVQENDNAVNILHLKEYLELQQHERKELCKSVSRLSDDRQNLKQTIVSLEALVSELNAKVAYHKSKSTVENLRQRNAPERTSIGAEKSSLQIACRQLEANNALLTYQLAEREAQQKLILKHDASDIGIRYMLWKYNRCESYRKALIWQKNYLLTLLEGFQKTESQTMQRLASIAQRNKNFQDDNESLSPSCRFRPAVLVIISIHRMKYLVKRWQLGKRVEDASINLNSQTDSDTDSLRNSEDCSSSRLLAPHSEANVKEKLVGMEVCSMAQITGQTPPTKEKGKNTTKEQKSGTQKKLCYTGSLSNFDDYIFRIEHIHATLGIPSSTP